MSTILATKAAAVAVPMPGMVTTWTCGETGSLPKAGGNLAEQEHGLGGGRRGVGLFDDGEAGHGLALGVVGGALGEMRLLIILVALGLADREGHGQAEAAEEQFEVDGVLAGGIDAD